MTNASFHKYAYDFPAQVTYSGKVEHATGYTTPVAGLLVLRCVHPSDRGYWIIVHAPSGYRLSKRLKSLRVARVIVRVMAVLSDTWVDLDAVRGNVQRMGLERWYREAVQ